ncbi:MAG: hypothetical protein HN731_06975 [Rhodospirillaceae bacterium]|nr:hypothetical protein [Rhodospirillaceae bacterium]MBT4939352.1 hypothetical protein [Rhodospirillaceae bacterium]MBT7954915.1 hypothetical protein [Rhodospirillaceae bacterium]
MGRKSESKKTVSIRLDTDIIAFFKSRSDK